LALSSRFESTNSNAYTSPKPTKSSYPQANPRSRVNDVDPHAALAAALAKPNDHPAERIDELSPWNWKDQISAAAQASIAAAA